LAVPSGNAKSIGQLDLGTYRDSVVVAKRNSLGSPVISLEAQRVNCSGFDSAFLVRCPGIIYGGLSVQESQS
jgi:hypothetical protein